MAVSDKPWGGFSAADYSDAEYARACLIDQNAPGATKVKGKCKLPVREPSGALNRNGVHAAAAALAGARGGVQASPAEKAAAARKLKALYREIGEQPPASVARMAG